MAYFTTLKDLPAAKKHLKRFGWKVTYIKKEGARKIYQVQPFSDNEYLDKARPFITDDYGILAMANA